MIVQTDNRLADKSDQFTQRNFNIQAGAKAFQILTSSLYSDKELAVIRELTCNAYDAQKENGTLDIPVEIHIPNYIEQWFSIRDFGDGIPHDFMMGERKVIDGNGNTQKVGYTTAFHSTRDDSNDSIGGFGIGRMSALAVGDSYSVVSITKEKFKGKTIHIRRSYTVFMEGGMPNITFMGEEILDHTEGENRTGFQVSVPITNYGVFESKALRFLSNVDLKFSLKGTSQSVIQKEVILEKDNWRVFRTGYDSSGRNYSSDNNVYAKIGIVRYPLSASYLPHELQNKGFEIDFPIGSIEVTPSRESISYTAETVAIINKRCVEIIEEIKDEFQKKLSAAPNLWEARKMVSGLDSGEYSRFISIVQKCEYKGKVIFGSIKLSKYIVNNYYLSSKWSKRGSYEKLYKYNAFDIKVTEDKPIVFIIDDSLGDKDGNNPVKITYPALRYKKYLSNNKESQVYSMSEKTYLEIKATGDLEGGPDPIYLSKLPYDPIIRVKGNKKSKVFDAGEIFYTSKNQNHQAIWSDNSLLPKEGYYIIAGKYERSKLNGYSSDKYPTKLLHCSILKIPIDYVFAIHPRKEKSFLKEYPGWKPAAEIEGIIKKELDKQLNGVTVEEGVDDSTGNFLKNLICHKEFLKNPLIGELKDLIEAYEKQGGKELLNIANFYTIEVKKSSKILEKYQELMGKYPFLQFAARQYSYPFKDMKDEWIKYLTQ